MKLLWRDRCSARARAARSSRAHALPLCACPGDGGNIEGLYRQFAGTNCQCPAGTSSNLCPCANVTASAAPQYCTTLQNGLFAPVNGTQPAL